MTTTIKISDKTKAQVERLQARLILEKGIKVSQIEIIERIFEEIINSPNLLDKILEKDKGDENMVDWIQKTQNAPDWEISDSSENIDSRIAAK